MVRLTSKLVPGRIFLDLNIRVEKLNHNWFLFVKCLHYCVSKMNPSSGIFGVIWQFEQWRGTSENHFRRKPGQLLWDEGKDAEVLYHS